MLHFRNLADTVGLAVNAVAGLAHYKQQYGMWGVIPYSWDKNDDKYVLSIIHFAVGPKAPKHYDLEQEISKSTGQISMTFGLDIHVPQQMIPKA